MIRGHREGDATAGLSLGEYTALFCGALTCGWPSVVAKRGQARGSRRRHPGRHGQCDVGKSKVEEPVGARGGDAEIANFLCPGNLVVSEAWLLRSPGSGGNQQGADDRLAVPVRSIRK